jgi:hypothetical protein
VTNHGRPVVIDTSLVECIVAVVPDTESLVGIAAALAKLLADGAIRVLDLVVVVNNLGSGEVGVLGPDSPDGAPFRTLVDERMGTLLSERDVNAAASSLLPGAAGVLVVIEDRWAEVLSSAAVRAGGRVVGGARVPKARIEAALQALR